MGEPNLSIPEVPPDLDLVERMEDYVVELLDKLERIAIVMERFDNVMNPTLDMAEDALQEQRETRSEPLFPSVFAKPIAQAG
jgi:hypothetical protein